MKERGREGLTEVIGLEEGLKEGKRIEEGLKEWEEERLKEGV